MSYAVMPLNEWQKIVNSVRAKTGKMEPLLSTQVAAEIDSITVQSEERSIFGDYVQGTIYEITAEDLIGVTSISPYAFSYHSITSIELPDSVTSIGSNAFARTKLTSIEIPDTVTAIATSAFQACERLTFVKLSKNITHLDGYVFADCASLTSIDISNIISAGNGSFNSSGLTHIIVPGTMNTIPHYFCQNCKSLTSVRLENGVAKINDGSFRNCTALMEIVCLSTNPPSIYHNCFDNVPADCVIKVPAAAVEAYKAATNWSVRADYIIAYEE